MQGSGQLAEDDAAAQFSGQDARAQIAEAIAFRVDAEALPRREGWLK